MDLLTPLASLAGWLIGLAFFALQVWLVSVAARRILGIRVGWLRTVLVSAVAVLGLLELFQWIARTNQLHVDPAHYPGPYMLVLGLIVLWGFALAVAALVGLEVMLPSGSLPTAGALFGWGRHWRRGRRYAQILGIVSRHGLGAYLRGVRRTPDDDSRTAVALRRALDDAGVTFIKLGQMLATRGDLLPPAYVRELSRLQTRAEPVPWGRLEPVLRAELGRDPDEVFASLDPEPLASASVAQVHAATLRDGRRVVVKVQRPGAAAQVDQDLDIMVRLARSLDRNADWARRLGVLGLAEGFGDSLREELDYRTELDNMRALRSALANGGVRVPWVAEELCTPRLIVMERFDATPISKAADLLAAWPDERRRAAATTLLRSVLDQILVAGVFHADLHGGNVVVWPDGTTGLLDFGSVGRLDAVSRRSLALLLYAIDADDPVLATDSLLDLLDRPADLDDRALQRSVGTLITRFRGGLGSAGSVGVFGELFDLVVRHGLRIPPAIAAALRALGAIEGTLLLLDPRLDLVAAARTAGRDVVGPVTPERLKEEATLRLVRLLPVLDAVPRRLDKITADLERGELSVNVRVLANADDRAYLAGLVQQLVAAILAGAAVLGGILLATSPGGPMLLPTVSLFAFAGYLLAFAGLVLALRCVALVFGRRGPS